MFVGIDIGGTQTRIVVSESLYNVVLRDTIVFSTPQNFNEGVEEIIRTISSLGQEVDAIAVGLPGSINDEGFLQGSRNLNGWVGRPLKRLLEEEFQCVAYIANDAELGALGEACFGGIDISDFFYLTWGTGVGCAQVTWRNGFAEVSRPGNREPVYKLEEKIGGKNIEKRLNKQASDLNDADWEKVFTDLTESLPELVSDYGYDTVVIGGGIAATQYSRLSECVDKLSIKALVTRLEGRAGLYGAFSLIRDT